MDWIFYYNQTHPDPQMHGMICNEFGGSEQDIVANLGDYKSYILRAHNTNTEDQYVDLVTLELLSKSTANFTVSKTSIIADAIDECVIGGLPVPCLVCINGEFIPIDDGSLEFSTDKQGLHVISFSSAEYKYWEVMIYAI